MLVQPYNPLTPPLFIDGGSVTPPPQTFQDFLELLDMPRAATSWKIEMVKPVCSCGRVLAFLEYDIAMEPRPLTWPEICKKYKILKMCCRNEFLCKIVTKVVSNDIEDTTNEPKLT